MKKLSKSKFLSGTQCEKKLWYDYNRTDLKQPVDERTQAVFDLGHRIGILALEMFPNGKDATPEDYSNLKPSIDKTQQWIAENEQTIYEATFSTDNAFCMLDILHQENGELWAIEVKSSTGVKDYHITDASLQYYVMKKNGVVPDKFFLMHINNQYVKIGEITSELFTLTDITDFVIENQGWVEENLYRLQEMLKSKTEPKIEIGNQCNSPFSCEYQYHCWKHVPENSVFELYRGGHKGWELYEQKVLKLEDIPDDFPLTHFQTLQRNSLKNNEKYFNKEAVKNEISHWEFPLYFFDFETVFPAIPIIDGTRPYQQVPFQYSLHIMTKNGNISHKEFLANPEDFSNAKNPLQQMVDQMKQDFGTKGNIVTYNCGFEIMVLNMLAEHCASDADFLHQLVSRVVDLLPVFRGGHCYFPVMKNSASIKYVLPAIAPEFTYQNLEIQEGGTASDLYLQSIENKGFVETTLSRNLLKYCERDTEAMVIIYQFLINKIY